MSWMKLSDDPKRALRTLRPCLERRRRRSVVWRSRRRRAGNGSRRRFSGPVSSCAGRARPRYADIGTVWLSTPARRILHGLKRSGRWVFPSPRRDRPCDDNRLDRFWWEVRAEAGISDVRLHDLRHTHASIALRQGETVLAIGRLLGHASAATTLKYTHPADAMAREAAEKLGDVLGARVHLVHLVRAIRVRVSIRAPARGRQGSY